MNDLKLAKEVLKKEQRALVIVKGGKVIYKSNERGIKPMYEVATTLKDKVAGASLADKVIGKAAAMLALYSGITYLYADIISEAALQELGDKITLDYAQKVDFIKNREKTGMCPVETLSQKVNNPQILLERIENFLATIAKA